MVKRKDVIEWWNELSYTRKNEICIENAGLVGSVRNCETLTSKEIKMIYNVEYDSDFENLSESFKLNKYK